MFILCDVFLYYNIVSGVVIKLDISLVIKKYKPNSHSEGLLPYCIANGSTTLTGITGHRKTSKLVSAFCNQVIEPVALQLGHGQDFMVSTETR